MNSKRQKIETAVKKTLNRDEICPHSSGIIGTYKRLCPKCIADVVVKALEKRSI
jgi:hypothetical protein